MMGTELSKALNRSLNYVRPNHKLFDISQSSSHCHATLSQPIEQMNVVITLPTLACRLTDIRRRHRCTPVPSGVVFSTKMVECSECRPTTPAALVAHTFQVLHRFA